MSTQRAAASTAPTAAYGRPTITLPRGVRDTALLILNIPNPYARGTNYPDGNFGLLVKGVVLSAFACFTYNEKVPPSTGRVPTTLSAVTPLTSSAIAPAAAGRGPRFAIALIGVPVH